MRIALPVLSSLLSLVLAACSSVPLSQPPVEQRGFQKIPPVYAPGGNQVANRLAVSGASSPTAAAASQPARPGYYVVQQGDTLYRIATRFGTNWQTLAQWNGLTDANAIEVGQSLRVVPPAGGAASAPAPGPGAAQAYPVAPAPATHPAPAAPPSTPRPAAQPPSPAGPVVVDKDLASNTEGGITWSWPSAGKVIQSFNGITSKGVDIAGKLGDPVYAAAAGRVVYAGSELRGFGKLIILKHNDDYISVYAHNNALLVKEGESVKRGQKIAEMGSTDAPRVELHFEIRLRGKSINPVGLLPKQP